MILACSISLAVTVGCSGPRLCVNYTPALDPTPQPRPTPAALSPLNTAEPKLNTWYYEKPGERSWISLGKLERLDRQGYCFTGVIYGATDLDYESSGSKERAAGREALLAEMERKAAEVGGDILLVLDDNAAAWQSLTAAVLTTDAGSPCPIREFHQYGESGLYYNKDICLPPTATSTHGEYKSTSPESTHRDTTLGPWNSPSCRGHGVGCN